MLHCYLTTEMSRIFLHQPSLRKLKGLLHIQSYSTNWNNKPKKKRKQTPKLSLLQRLFPRSLSCNCVERVPLHVLANAGSHHTETEQSPTRVYTAKFTCAAFAAASLSHPGWDKIYRWTFLKPLLEGKHLSCTCNELRTKQEWHPAQLLNYHSVK